MEKLCFGKGDKWNLVDLKLITSDNTLPHRKEYYLSATYNVGNDECQYEVKFPHIKFPIITNQRPIMEPRDLISACQDLPMRINLGFGFLELDSVGKVSYEAKILKRKMTVQEIEKLLGYEVEIVS